MVASVARAGRRAGHSSIEAVTDRISLEDHVSPSGRKTWAARVMLSLINVPVVWLLVLVG